MILSAIFTTLAFTREKKLNIKIQTLRFTSGDGEISIFLSAPSVRGKFPAIILIHEQHGLTDWEKENAIRFASKGYVALVVNFYNKEALSVSAIKSTLEYLKSREDVDPSRIGIVGWQIGGELALKSLIEIPDFKAGVICYTKPVEDEANLQRIKASILGIFASQDQEIPLDLIKNFEEKMKNLGKKIEIKIYPDVSGNFMNPNNKNNYDEILAKNAWDLIEKFFRKNLKPR